MNCYPGDKPLQYPDLCSLKLKTLGCYQNNPVINMFSCLFIYLRVPHFIQYSLTTLCFIVKCNSRLMSLTRHAFASHESDCRLRSDCFYSSPCVFIVCMSLCLRLLPLVPGLWLLYYFLILSPGRPLVLVVFPVFGWCPLWIHGTLVIQAAWNVPSFSPCCQLTQPWHSVQHETNML